MVSYEQIRQQLFSLGLLRKNDDHDAFALVKATSKTTVQADSTVDTHANEMDELLCEQYVCYAKVTEGIALLAVQEDRLSDRVPIVIPLSMIEHLEVRKGFWRDRLQFVFNEKQWQFEIPHRIKDVKWQNQARKQLLHCLMAL